MTTGDCETEHIKYGFRSHVDTDLILLNIIVVSNTTARRKKQNMQINLVCIDPSEELKFSKGRQCKLQ